jgi:murein DD-endopeptidase MepM/ murein hydrolase activator NlpD
MGWKTGIKPLRKTRFTEMLIEENALDRNGFECWLFCAGMQFGSLDKWWGDHGRRDFPHEGIDLCLYKDRFEQPLRMDEQTRIPVVDDGTVMAVFKDFLGKAVIIQHDHTGIEDEGFLSIYAHTEPRNNIRIGAKVKEGEIIATIADTRGSKSRIIPHLHFSIGLPSPAISYELFAWNTIRESDMVTLLDPLEIIDGPFQMLDDNNPYCLKL